MKHRYDQTTSDFVCKHCRGYVSTDPSLSGVNNRNHCPYCLFSRHMDWREPGDRLSACNGQMAPVGLALKQIRKKYGSQQGELMVVHQCMECGKISANRIAADDDPENLLTIFESSLNLNQPAQAWIAQSGIQALDAGDRAIVHARLFGWGTPAPVQVAG